MPKPDVLTAEFAANFPDSFARVIKDASADDISQVLNQLPPATRAPIVARLPGLSIVQLLDSGAHNPTQWLADAAFDDAVTLLSRIPRERRLAIVNSLNNTKLRNRLLRNQQYPTHSVGALISDVVLRIRIDADAADIAQELRAMEGDYPTAMVVVDAGGHYAGLLNLWRLLSHDPPTGTIRNYVRKIDAVHPETTIANAVKNDEWFAYSWLPVIDQERRVLGGVSREKLFRSARASQERDAGAPAIFFELLSASVLVLGALVERIISPRGSS